MKKVLIAMMFLITSTAFATDKHTVTADLITKFYKSYIEIWLDDNSRSSYENEIRLLKENTTKEAFIKIDMDGRSTGTDQVLRAQDTSPNILQAIKAAHLTDDWYMVSYPGYSEEISIPLKAITVDGKLQITYIPHSSNGLMYGDDLLGCPTRTKISDISQESAGEFLESFFDVYISSYCMMSPDIDSNTTKLKSIYLTQNAHEEIKAKDVIMRGDGLTDYDLVIDNFYFDPMWYKGLKVEEQEDGRFKILIKRKSYVVTIIYTIIKTEQGYMIDSIETKY